MDRLAELAKIAEQHPTESWNELTARVNRELGVTVGFATVRSRLVELGFRRHMAPSCGPNVGGTDEAVVEKARSYGYHEGHRYQGPECAYPSSLTDAEWELVRDLFERKGGKGKPATHSRRAMVDAMLYVVRGGVSWRMLPTEFPPWLQVFKTFQRWNRQGRFEAMYDRLRGMVRERAGRAVNPTAAVIDSQSVDTGAQGGPKGYDAAKKVKGRKRHLMVDTLGLLLVVLIQTADVQDRDGAMPVVVAGKAKYPSVVKLYTDGGYSGTRSDAIRVRFPDLDVEAVRHPGNRTVGYRAHPDQLPLPGLKLTRAFVVLPKRWVVERTHAWNDRPRRLGRDNERTIESATGWIWLAEARMLARRITWEETRMAA